MKKAIIVLAHQKPAQLNMLLRQLLVDPQIDVFIHVNKLNENIIPDILQNERVKVSKNNIPIHWGSDEILAATLNMYREVLKSGAPYEYILVISGQDMLVRNGLDEFLTEHKGKIFIDMCNKPTPESIHSFDMCVRARALYTWPEIYRRRIDFRYNPVRIMRAIRYRSFLKGIPFCKKKIDYDVSKMTFYKDFYWNALPVETVEYILDFIDKNPTYMSIYHEAYQPEEGFISTLIINSGYQGDPELLQGKGKSLTFTKDMENNHAPLLGMDDVEMIESSGCFFARKFDVDYDSTVINHFMEKTGTL